MQKMGLEPFSLQNQTGATLPPAELIIALSSLSKVSEIRDFWGGLLQGFTPGLRQQGPSVKFALAILLLSCPCRAGAAALSCREGRASAAPNVGPGHPHTQTPVPSPAPLLCIS